jgi:hypothetical protein
MIEATATSITADHSNGIWKFCIAPMMMRPRPCGAPNHSPRIAPIIAAASARRAPLAMDGSAAGSSRRQSRTMRVAPSTEKKS